MPVRPIPRPGIMEISPYVGGRSSAGGHTNTIKLSSNESARGPSPKAQDAYRELASSLHRYPDGGATALRAALGALHGIDGDRIVCGNGSDELLQLPAPATRSSIAATASWSMRWRRSRSAPRPSSRRRPTTPPMWTRS